jgi:hypothetical protein
MVLHGNRKERREELDSQRELERLADFVGILADEPAEGQGVRCFLPLIDIFPYRVHTTF